MNTLLTYAIIFVLLLLAELLYLSRFASFPRWLRLPLSRLGIVKASFASALAAPSVCTSAIEASFIALGLASVLHF